MSITPFPYLTVCLAAACLLLAAGGGAALARSRRKIRQLIDALDYMSQGLCMFDAAERMPHGGWVSTHEDVTEQRILQPSSRNAAP
jgi:hypothetical protein